MAHDRDPLIVCSFGRSGTHLLIDLVRRQFGAFDGWKWPGERTNGLYIALEAVAEQRCSPERIDQVLGRSARAIIKSHDWPAAYSEVAAVAPDFAAWLQARAAVVYVTRDPVAALSRLWASGIGRGNDPGIPAEAFITAQAERWSAHIDDAIAQPEALIVRFEDLVGRPAGVVARLSAYLREPAREKTPLLVTPLRNRRDHLLARLAMRPRSTHVLPAPGRRRTVPLDWTPARIELLRQIAGRAAAKAGYVLP